MQLQDKVAVITGGSQGIGHGIAAAFLAEGASVMISGRSEDKGAAALADLDAGDRAAVRRRRRQVAAGVEALIDATVERFGAVHILVNNAGGSSGFALVEDLTDEAWQEAPDWMLNSTFWATRRALKPMVAQGFGRIINIGVGRGQGRQQGDGQPLHHEQARHQRVHQGGRLRVRRRRGSRPTPSAPGRSRRR